MGASLHGFGARWLPGGMQDAGRAHAGRAYRRSTHACGAHFAAAAAPERIVGMAAGTLLVFGARNLGKALASDFVARGWNVAAVARSEETIAVLGEAVPDALGIVADATEAEEVERAFAATERQFGPVDLVVNAITPRPRGRIGGGELAAADPDAIEPYVAEFLPAVWHVLRVGARVLAEQGRGTLVQVSGGSARRGNPGRGPWAAAAFATRALVQSAAGELRERGVHAALLIVDAVIESEKTKELLAGQ